MPEYPSEQPGDWWDQFDADRDALYAQAGQAPNLKSITWNQRTAFDMGTGMDWEVAKLKHLNELRQALGLPIPFEPAPREWRTNMCGMRVAGLPPVTGGAGDATLFLSWFYDRYDAPTRACIRAAAKARGWQHWLLSWPDSRSIGQSPNQFRYICQELIDSGFYPCPMLYSKDCDPRDFDGIMANIQPVLPALVGFAPAVCIGWELSIALSPTTVQQLIDALAPQFTPAGTRVYVHFQEGYFSFPQPDHDNASFWWLQVGKLTGVLYQRRLSDDRDLFQAHLADCTARCAGNFNMPSDSGFGHPFDTVALEITASNQFNEGMSEAEGNQWGDVALATPPQGGPAGAVWVMGSGNGWTP